MVQTITEKIYKQIQTKNGKPPVSLSLGINTFTILCKEVRDTKNSGLVINQDGNFSLWGIKIKLDYAKRNLVQVNYK